MYDFKPLRYKFIAVHKVSWSTRIFQNLWLVWGTVLALRTSKIQRQISIQEWICTVAYKMFNAQKKSTFVIPCLLAFRFDSPHLCSGGLPHPLQILLDSSCPVTLFFQHCPAASSELSSLGHGSTILHPELKHNTCVPIWNAPGREFWGGVGEILGIA